MNIRQSKPTFCCLIMIGLLLGSIVWADSAERPATPAEKAFYSSVMNTFIKAVPSKPEGWDQDVFCHDTELVRVTTGLEQYPFRVFYFIGWRDNKTINAGQERLAAGVMELSKTGNLNEKSIADLEKKVTPHDVNLRIDLQANLSSLGIYEVIKPAPAIAGGLVYRSESKYDSSGGWREGTTYIFLGKAWRLAQTPTTYLNFTFNKSTPALAVQNIMVKIYADPNRAQMIAQKIDWGSLNKIIQN